MSFGFNLDDTDEFIPLYLGSASRDFNLVVGSVEVDALLFVSSVDPPLLPCLRFEVPAELPLPCVLVPPAGAAILVDLTVTGLDTLDLSPAALALRTA